MKYTPPKIWNRGKLEDGEKNDFFNFFGRNEEAYLAEASDQKFIEFYS